MDDPRIVQRVTTIPPPLLCNADRLVECADPLAYALWQGHHLKTVGQVEEAWAEMCFKADEMLGEMGACRFFLNWIDDTDRAVMIRELLVEVEIALAGRKPTNTQALAA